MTPACLVAVIGPVEAELFKEFVCHYRGLGVEEFSFAFHFPNEALREASSDLLAACEDLVGPPAIISGGPWHESLHGELRDRLRTLSRPGWQIIADSDEFHAYPEPLPELLEKAESTESPIVEGLLLDRVSRNGELCEWDPLISLEESYPLGGFLTALMLYGDPRKVVLAKSDVPLTLGSHRTRSGRFAPLPRVPVHHFKWRAGIVGDLSRRVIMHTAGAWQEVTPDIRTEAARFLAHIAANDNRVNVQDPDLRFRPVTLKAQPEWWQATVASVLREWQSRYQSTTGRQDAFGTAGEGR